ncbi:MAG: hypothetical protein AB8H80_11650 [Planctomycetota bacterium]
MFVAATMSLLFAVAPQGAGSGGNQSDPAVLSAGEHKKLQDNLRKYLDAEREYDFAEGIRGREKAAKARTKAKEKFEKIWRKADDKGALASVTDLRTIFHNCFLRERPKHSYARLRVEKLDEGMSYALWAPKEYSVKKTFPLLLTLPSRVGDAWMTPEEYFKATWQGTEQLNGKLLHMPVIPDELELDPVPDYSREGAKKEEGSRNRIVLGTLGYLLKNYTVERSKVFLDCGRGSSGYGLRLATLFPDRFTGVILRDAIEVDDIRIGSLHGMPILMLETDQNSKVVRDLEKRIEAKCPGTVTVLKAQGEYPHLESAPDIGTWLADKERNMTPQKVVLEPNHDSFKKSYWVDIVVAESLQRTGPDEKPRLVATADRESNRITIECQSVERFELLLNDAIVDLDKEFTLVINGKAVTAQRNRSFNDMKDRVVTRNDWDYLFPVRYRTSVPKDVEEGDGKDGDQKGK